MTATALAVLSASGCSTGNSSSPDAGTATPPPAAPSGTPTPDAQTGTDTFGSDALLNGLRMDANQARFTVDALVQKPAEPMDGFDPAAFSTANLAVEAGWEADTLPDPGCTVEQAVKARDAVNTEVDNGCSLGKGTWVDPFTDQTTNDPAEFTVITGVPLAEVWRAGGANWDAEQIEVFANASDVLLTADPAQAQARDDRGPQTWKPPEEASWCDYAIRWVSVKSTYGLSVTSTEEVTALKEMLQACGTPTHDVATA